MEPEMYHALRRVAEDLAGMPGIGKVEIAEGNVIVMMAPVNRHEHAVAWLWRQIDAQVAKTHPGYIAHAGAEIEDSVRGVLRCPDLLVLPAATLANTADAVRPDEVLLVVEIVSRSNPMNDYRGKVVDYAAMGIPHYVIVDPRDGTGVVHSLPGYPQRTPFVFGDTVSVGPWKLDTSVLYTYAPAGMIADAQEDAQGETSQAAG
jgi:Uma2 family endonuclease